MKTALLGLFFAVVGSITAHAALSWTTITEEEFFGVNVTSKVLNVEMVEQGNAQSNPALWELGIGDGAWQQPATVAHYDWIVNQYHTFRIELDASGNCTLSLDGITQLTDQPLGAIGQLWLGNRNGSGVPFQRVWLRELTINGLGIPNLDTAGPSSFSGVRIDGLEGSEWVLEGKLQWQSDADTLAHSSRISVFGEIPSIPEPASWLMFMLSSLALLLKRSRPRWRAFLICRVDTLGCSRHIRRTCCTRKTFLINALKVPP